MRTLQRLSILSLSYMLISVLFSTPLGAYAERKTSQVVRLESLVYPVSYPRLSSVFGNRMHPIKRIQRHHGGVDLAAPEGSFVRAVSAGRIVFADTHGGYGKLIVIQHNNGITTHYGHLERIDISIGQYVLAGEQIGAVGSTGNSTGPHLHFEVRKEGKTLDPMNFLPEFGTAPKG